MVLQHDVYDEGKDRIQGGKREVTTWNFKHGIDVEDVTFNATILQLQVQHGALSMVPLITQKQQSRYKIEAWVRR